MVGYDNSKQAWLIKNSWGREFANEGFAWVPFSAPGMCDPQTTHGLKFFPRIPPTSPPAQLTPAPTRRGCYTYKAGAGEYPEGVAERFGVRLSQLLLDNLDVIKEPSQVPPGASLVLCGVSHGALVMPSPASSSAVSNAVSVLLAIRGVLDPAGNVLGSWQRGSSSPCSWRFIRCNRDQQVIAIHVTGAGDMTGRLPSGALLQQLPALEDLVLLRGLTGPLPADWSRLKQLKRVYLRGTQLTGGMDIRWSLSSCG